MIWQHIYNKLWRKLEPLNCMSQQYSRIRLRMYAVRRLLDA